MELNVAILLFSYSQSSSDIQSHFIAVIYLIFLLYESHAWRFDDSYAEANHVQNFFHCCEFAFRNID